MNTQEDSRQTTAHLAPAEPGRDAGAPTARADRWTQRAADAVARFAPDYVSTAWLAWLVIVAGAATLLGSQLRAVHTDGSLPAALAFSMVGVALVARIFPLEIRGARSDHTVSDAFIIYLALLHGSALATLAVACATAIETRQRTSRMALRMLNAALSALMLYAVLSVFEHAYALLATRLTSPDSLMALRALVAVALATLHLALYRTAQVAFFALKSHAMRSPLRGARMRFRINWTDASAGVLAACLYVLASYLRLDAAGQMALLTGVLLLTLPLHWRQRAAAAQIQRLRLASAEHSASQTSRTLERAQVSGARFHSAFADAAVGMAIVDARGRILTANRALRRLLGVERLSGVDVRRYIYRDDVVLLSDALNALVASEAGASGTRSGAAPNVVELRCVQSDGRIVIVALHSGMFQEQKARTGEAEAEGTAPRAAGMRLILQFQDVTSRHRAQASMYEYAFYDSVTRLYNRLFFAACLRKALEAASREPTRRVALLYIDFDRFKAINDQYGHSAGDEFLVTVSGRLSASVRAGDVVARLGGDEFAVLAEAFDSDDEVIALADRILQQLREPYAIAGVKVRSSASIGVAFRSSEHPDESSMMRAADSAMYAAKAAGRDRVTVFDEQLRAEVRERRMIDLDLLPALERDELALSYQPIFSLDSTEVVALEALLRWDHPTLGRVSPQRIVAVAEESAAMPALTRWVLHTACAQAVRLAGIGMGHLPIHVNVSGSDVARPDFVDVVEQALHGSGAHPKQLAIEVTESILMRHLDVCSQMLQRVSELGVHVSIDDFGTGHSSLAYIARLPFTSLKIDSSFVAALSDGRDAEVVRTIVAMAQALGKNVIAEGIEVTEQVEQLRELGCSFGQGYLVSPPVAAESLIGWLLMHRSGDGSAPRLAASADHIDDDIADEDAGWEITSHDPAPSARPGAPAARARAAHDDQWSGLFDLDRDEDHHDSLVLKSL